MLTVALHHLKHTLVQMTEIGNRERRKGGDGGGGGIVRDEHTQIDTGINIYPI